MEARVAIREFGDMKMQPSPDPCVEPSESTADEAWIRVLRRPPPLPLSSRFATELVERQKKLSKTSGPKRARALERTLCSGVAWSKS